VTAEDLIPTAESMVHLAMQNYSTTSLIMNAISFVVFPFTTAYHTFTTGSQPVSLPIIPPGPRTHILAELRDTCDYTIDATLLTTHF
jgi:hypothetical protein